MQVVTGSSPMYELLEIPELLYMIFNFLDDASNASNARVCKQWSEIALDTLWRDIGDLYRVFGLLAPLEESDDGEYEFVETLDAGAWKIFNQYSRRVHRLSYHATQAIHTLRQSVFDDIARTRTSLEIFPNLKTLEWDAPLSICVMFMHSNIKIFIVHLPENLRPQSFFLDIVSRMPNITHLDLRTNIPIHSIESSAIELFCGLTKLQELTLPQFYFTTKIAECLSRLEGLSSVDFEYSKSQGRGDPEDTMVFKPALTQGAFPSLRNLSIIASFNDTAHFINLLLPPTNLTILYVDSCALDTSADVYFALDAIAVRCPLLTSLELISFVDPNTVSGDQPPQGESITIETLQPLLKCHKITYLKLVHQHPLELWQADIEKIAVKWPLLKTLLLNNGPAYIHKPTLTLNALLPFALHCPNLHRLGLFIRASLPQPDPLSTYLYMPFRNLRHLSMGASIINECNPVALFLSRICPLRCHISSGVAWNKLITAEAIAKRIRTRSQRWKKVMELLPLLTEARTEERDRIRGLQSEVEDLRMRMNVLMDKTT